MELIALRTVRYNDKNSILSAFTAERGRVSLFVPASGSKEARRRRALLMPLSVVDAEIDVRPGRDIFNLREVRPLSSSLSIISSPVKSVIALFIADFLNSMLRQESADILLFEFLKEEISALEAMDDEAAINDHIGMLCRLSRFMGIQPDLGSYRKGAFFDMNDGVWRISPPLHTAWVDQAESRMVFLVMSRMTDLSNHMSKLLTNRGIRNRAIDILIEYYTLHFTKLSLPSLDVLRDMS